MGYARMLVLLVAVAGTAMTAQAAVAAADVLVRVEAMPPRASPNPLLTRKAVNPTGPLTKTAGSPTCAADSPAAALDAAVGRTGWDGTFDPVTGKLSITTILGVAAPTPPADPTAQWRWVAYADQAPVADPCTDKVPPGAEALFFPQCTDRTKPSSTCYTGGVLYGLVGDTGPLYPISPVIVPYYNAPVAVYARLAEDGKIGPTIKATATSDEGYVGSTQDERGFGVASMRFSSGGPHTLTVTQPGKVPVSVPVCATDGGDGFCGSPKTQPPPQIPYGDSPCETNGRDGNCGTIDTSGPVTNVTNITQNQGFKKKKAPGQVKGTIALDPASVKDVMLRVTRVSTQRVRVKAKKPKKGQKKPKSRYKTIKRCTVWDDASALFEAAHCGAKYAKWFPADLDDLVRNFSYDFALTLPPGKYLLEVMSHDLDGHPDDVVVGRTVLTFTVATT